MERNDAALKRKEGHAADLAPYPRVCGGLHHVGLTLLTKQQKPFWNRIS